MVLVVCCRWFFGVAICGVESLWDAEGWPRR